jgi:bla regulator protein blaR1
MITYLFKTIVCSSVFILIYYLFLEKEKIHRFNRFYLLFSIAFSSIVPLITIKIKSAGIATAETINLIENNIQDTVSKPILQSTSTNNSISNILLYVYIAFTAALFLRFLINISVILVKIWRSNPSEYQSAKIVLINDSLCPHSFFNYVFVNFKDYKEGKIEDEILSHELTHVKQKHSFDILFLELLLIFAWINPILFIYKKAIQLNHEFLADESVVNTFKNTQSYQLLLFEKAAQTNSYIFSSPFNYLLTKKRIIMMSKKASLKVAILKQIALIPIIIASGFIFTSKSTAQDSLKVLQQKIESTTTGVSNDILNEYRDIMEKYKRTLSNGRTGYFFNLSQTDKERLESIFFQMSKEQQSAQMFQFIPNSSMVLKRSTPTKEQFESYKDPKMYGVWIDEQRVSNSDLSNYKNTDFAHVFESILMKNATNYGKHVYQVNLMTNDHFQRYYDKQISDKGYTLMMRPPKKDSIK